MAVNFAAAVGRLGFEAIVQRETPAVSHGRAFAQFETRFQFGWATAGVIPVIIAIPGQIGFLLAGMITGVALANYFVGVRSVPSRAVAVRQALARRLPRRLPAGQRQRQPRRRGAAHDRRRRQPRPRPRS